MAFGSDGQNSKGFSFESFSLGKEGEKKKTEGGSLFGGAGLSMGSASGVNASTESINMDGQKASVESTGATTKEFRRGLTNLSPSPAGMSLETHAQSSASHQGTKQTPLGVGRKVSVELPAQLKNKTIGEIVDEWNKEIQRQTREYKRQSSDVCGLDRQITENEGKIAQLKQEVETATKEQGELEGGLKQIAEQQSQLEKILDELEEEFEKSVSGRADAGGMYSADQERAQAYRKAEEAKKEIDSCSEALGQMLSQLPETAEKENGMVDVARVLGFQLEALQCADKMMEKLRSSIQEIKEREKEKAKRL
ncbi:MAG: uncharacterized protein A8A55_1182 [Amphiamblys sp. WSBS2006]|nr:MAG: uncharacterized protein A8A55_1182 [Amphiamblys sp. WSBS2006]